MACPPPLAEPPARLGWTLERDFYWDAEGRPESLILRYAPDLPGVLAPAGRDLVLDPLALVESLRRPGGYSLLTCSCGLSDHLGIHAPVFVSHPDAETVVWELDIPETGPALDPRWRGRPGYLRLSFRREAYRESILGMLRAARDADSAGLPVEELEPDLPGGAWERWMALDPASLSPPTEPVLPAGSLLEVATERLSHLDGRPLNVWLPRLFPRWAAYDAFKRDDPELAAILARAFAEGSTAPGVTVRWLPGGSGGA